MVGREGIPCLENDFVMMISSAGSAEWKVTYHTYYPFHLHHDVRGEMFKYTEENCSRLASFSNDKVQNLYQYPLTVNIFTTPLRAEPVYDKNGALIRYKFVDGELLYHLSEKMNFKIEYYKEDFQDYGLEYPNGTFVGALQYVNDKLVEFSANTRILAKYNTTNCVYLRPLYPVPFVFVVPRRDPARISLNISILSSYDNPTKIIFISCMALLILIWYLVEVFVVRGMTFMEIMLMYWQTQNNISITFGGVVSDFQKLLLGTLLLFFIIITNTYQGNITSQLTAKPKSNNINSLEELLQTDFNFTTLAFITEILSLFPDPKSIQYRLSRRMSPFDFNIDPILEGFNESVHLGMLIHYPIAADVKMKLYNKETGEDIIHIVPGVPITLLDAIMIVKSSPYISAFNDIILRITEVGFVQFALRASQFEMEQKKYIRTQVRINMTQDGHQFEEGGREHVIRMEDLQVLFYLWLLFLFISFVAFLYERNFSHVDTFLQ